MKIPQRKHVAHRNCKNAFNSPKLSFYRKTEKKFKKFLKIFYYLLVRRTEIALVFSTFNHVFISIEIKAYNHVIRNNFDFIK